MIRYGMEKKSAKEMAQIIVREAARKSKLWKTDPMIASGEMTERERAKVDEQIAKVLQRVARPCGVENID